MQIVPFVERVTFVEVLAEKNGWKPQVFINQNRKKKRPNKKTVLKKRQGIHQTIGERKSCPPIWSYFSSLYNSEILQFKPPHCKIKKKKTFHLSLKRHRHQWTSCFFGWRNIQISPPTSPINFKENAPGNHWSPRPQIESTLWRSDCTSPGSPIWEKDGKLDVGIFCKQKNLYIISSYIKLYISLCRYQSVSINIYVNLYSNLQYINLCNPFLRHSAVVHKVHRVFSTRGRCQRRENLRE